MKVRVPVVGKGGGEEIELGVRAGIGDGARQCDCPHLIEKVDQSIEKRLDWSLSNHKLDKHVRIHTRGSCRWLASGER